MKLTSFGAAQTVTGSKHILEYNNAKFLIDCGIFQGSALLTKKNVKELEFAKDVKHIFLTHAHMDHSGMLAALVRQGFHGHVYATSQTMALTNILLRDGQRIQMQEQKKLIKQGQRKELIPDVLYDIEDIEKLMNMFVPVTWNESFNLKGLEITFRPSGHILGASSIWIKSPDKVILFSGDLGRFDDQLVPPPQVNEKADYIIMESTYLNRVHVKEDPVEMLATIFKERDPQGAILIASFAVQRLQLLMYLIAKTFEKYPDLKHKVYIDSGLGISANKIYEKNCDSLKINKAEFKNIQELFIDIEYTTQRSDLQKSMAGKTIIASSGMLTGGRIMGYLNEHLINPKNILIQTGFQGEETLGRELWEGKRLGIYTGTKKVDVSAKVISLESLSSHADHNDLLYWLELASKANSKIFLVHGEAQNMRQFVDTYDKEGYVHIMVEKESVELI